MISYGNRCNQQILIRRKITECNLILILAISCCDQMTFLMSPCNKTWIRILHVSYKNMY